MIAHRGGTDVSERVAGRELDAEVAEKVMGGRWLLVKGSSPFLSMELPHVISGRVNVAYRNHAGGIVPGEHLPEYSTAIADAWQVAERMRSRGALVVLESRNAGGWWARMKLIENGRYVWRTADYENDARVVADTAPLAICLAALAALNADERGDVEVSRHEPRKDDAGVDHQKRKAALNPESTVSIEEAGCG